MDKNEKFRIGDRMIDFYFSDQSFRRSKLFTRIFHAYIVTYKEAHDLYKKKYETHIKSSYVADVLSSHGKTRRKGYSRKGGYKHPCPEKIRANLEKVLKELKML